MIYIAVFTEKGLALGKTLAKGLGDTFVFAPERFAGEGVAAFGGPIQQWTGNAFQQVKGLIFIGACGIAVRAIAPFLRGKEQDPAVIAVDQKGKFAIPLLSGHLGGANQLARQISALCGAVPVITTATDMEGIFAVDVWAKENNVSLLDVPLIKEISSRLLAGEAVGLACDFPVKHLPEGFISGPCQAGISISLEEGNRPFPITLRLVPRILFLGIGCRKGVLAGDLEAFVEKILESAKVSRQALAGVCTVELKRNEPGLLLFCEKWGLPLYTFSPQALMEIPGEFHSSPFVAQVTGADNICERAAAAGSKGKLFSSRQAENGITIALAIQEWTADFSFFGEGGGEN